MCTTSDRFDTRLILSGTTGSETLPRVNHGLMQRAPVPPLEVHTSALPRSFCWKVVLQGHVGSKHGWLVLLSGPGRSGGDEPGVEAIGGCVHNRRALKTQLFSSTSAGTFACPVALKRNFTSRNRYEKWTWHVFCTSSKKGLQNRSTLFEPKISWIFFRWLQVHP